MPAIHTNPWARDGDSPSEPAPGGSVSIEGGADSRNIVAMILATLLFIIVLIFYQYMSIVMARREAEARSSPGFRGVKARSDASILPWLSSKIKGLLDFLRRSMSKKSDAASDTSSISSTSGLVSSSSRHSTERRFHIPLELPCAGRGKSSSKSREAKRHLRPLLLGMEPRSPIDERTHEYLRSPLAFGFDDLPSTPSDATSERAEGSNKHRRSRHRGVWNEEPIRGPERPTDAIVAPFTVRKKIELQSREELAASQRAHSTSSRTSWRQITSPQMRLPVPTSPSAASYQSNIQEEGSLPRSFFDTDDEDVHKKHVLFNFSSPKSSPHDEDTFTIGDLSDSDGSTDGSGH
ncbi:hypothetical protein M0805_001454 [Coniferiporia weirii]|nr:hypothetical protein M0805_001454 [Coniferiporia weirii]